jgi:hypothetical protein
MDDLTPEQVRTHVRTMVNFLNERENAINQSVTLSLKRDSWINLFACIRTSKIESRGNFWAAIQHLEQQLEQQ